MIGKNIVLVRKIHKRYYINILNEYLQWYGYYLLWILLVDGAQV